MALRIIFVIFTSLDRLPSVIVLKESLLDCVLIISGCSDQSSRCMALENIFIFIKVELLHTSFHLWKESSIERAGERTGEYKGMKGKYMTCRATNDI